MSERTVRYKALHKMFQTTHRRGPQGAYEEYILKLIIELGAVYDDVTDEHRALLRTLKAQGKQPTPRLNTLRHQEDALNSLGILLRRAIRIQVKDNDGSPYNRSTQVKDEDKV